MADCSGPRARYGGEDGIDSAGGLIIVSVAGTGETCTGPLGRDDGEDAAAKRHHLQRRGQRSITHSAFMMCGLALFAHRVCELHHFMQKNAVHLDTVIYEPLIKAAVESDLIQRARCVSNGARHLDMLNHSRFQG